MTPDETLGFVIALLLIMAFVHFCYTTNANAKATQVLETHLRHYL